MDAFNPFPPEWTQSAAHAREFSCPTCRSASVEAEHVWINRRSPVFTEDHRRKWQEFYQCRCGTVWWAWSSDRPPTDLKQPDRPESPWTNWNLFDS
ncbi:hypothetical protein IQ268_05070 [Oculatella sp. LEGE 06141]|uniref:hypothetical protein n=1 Tax=Oculatella sp. LEGE 06141 TaxID=1828648 RepID=UPI00187FC5D3|nr:hypothetical protein [Oculatella sp. LEGE 06141]MBE9177954.1 hypothetical protein [Oculatella sp. LEGE 06141]